MNELMSEILKYINDEKTDLTYKDLFRKFLETSDINVKDINGNTLLIAASEKNLFEIASLLIENGINIDAKNFYKSDTALHEASSRGRTKIVKLLIENDANLLLRNVYGCTPYDKAKEYNRTEIMKLIEDAINEEKRQMIEHAKRIENKVNGNYHKTIFKEFTKNINVNLEDDYRTSILMLSVDLKEYEFVRLLLKNGANPNRYNYNGNCPLINAIYHEDLEMIKLLLRYGANPTYQYRNYLTPLEEATKGKKEEIINILTGKENVYLEENNELEKDNKSPEEIKKERILKLKKALNA